MTSSNNNYVMAGARHRCYKSATVPSSQCSLSDMERCNILLCFVAGMMLFSSAAISAETAADDQNEATFYYQEIVTDMEEKSETLRKHPLLDFIKDDTIPARRRISFAPYLSYIAMSFADILDTWLLVEEPRNELEERINKHITEDDYHYNLFLHDVESVLGLSLDDFGSYSGVMRHLWGDDSRAIRRYIYGWVDCVARYNDPIITLTTLEAMEAGAQALIGTTSQLVHRADSGLQDLMYLGQVHVDLEKNHSQFVWFNEEASVPPLGHLQITREQRDRAIQITEEMFERYIDTYSNSTSIAIYV